MSEKEKKILSSIDSRDLIEKLTCSPDSTVRSVLVRIDRSSPNLFQIVIDDMGRVIGTVTDGDVRRGMLAGVSLDDPIRSCMHHSPRVALQSDVDNNNVIIQSSFFLPVVDSHGQLTQVLTRNRHDSVIGRALVMAGGFGTRLGEKTKSRPKPLLEVGGKPILDYVLCQLEAAQISHIHIAVHYLGDQIENFILNRDNRSRIEIIKEVDPLGTAGALSKLPNSLDGPVLVINGDVITEVDLTSMGDFHFRHGYDGTVGAAPYEVNIPFGVLRHDKSGLLTSIEEKPTYQHLVAGGIYLVSPRIVGLITPGKPIDMPDILELAQQAGFRMGIFPVHEYWRDIGRPDDLCSADEEHK
tara:strand:- start:33820 stop:34884 length:1065 start_codon:yes stop_codon:yes gene_type:complete